MLSKPVEPLIHMEQDDRPLDEDSLSLFGSPPPSPAARGRSPSPILALPSTLSTGYRASSSSLSAQNVGTIALPGSHAHSEQSINPIAISLSLPGGSCAPLLPQSLPSSQPQSRHGSVGIGRNLRSGLSLPPRPRSSPEQRQGSALPRKQSKRKRQESAPRPSPLTISLPDPSQPLPPHFLRNQQALLGHAGLVARLQPSKLSTAVNAPLGTTSSNPIVLEDHETHEVPEPPVIGRSPIDHFKNLDLSRLPAPTNREIVDMLIKQKDIFPVLQSIFKLLVPGVSSGKVMLPTAVPGFGSWASRPDQDRSSPQPSAKRRKLRRVPAGAADWDVPYPFQEGEGPEAYKQNWMKERGRQLISQLIGLVKIAARKAAAKKHLVELQQKRQDSLEEQSKEKQGGKGANHYRNGNGNPSLATTTLPRHPQPSPTKVEPLCPGNLNIDPSGLTVEGSTSTTSFNDLFSALLAASNANDAIPSNSTPLSTHQPFGHPPSSQPASDPLTLFDVSSTSTENASQSIVDSWMHIFQNFQVDPQSSENVSLESLLGLDSPLVGDLSSFASPSSGDLSPFSTTPNPDARQTQCFPPLDFGQLGDLDFTPAATASPSSSGLGSFPSSSTTSTPMNYTFDFSAVTSDPLTSTTEKNLPSMDVDQPPQSLYSSTSVPTSAANADFTNLIDPQLLALSMPDHGTPAVTLSQSTSPSSFQPPESQKVTPNDTGACSPSAFLPSPVSSFDPATPSSAGWDISLPGVVATESDRDQGGVESSRVVQESLGCKDTGGTRGAQPGASVTLAKEVSASSAPRKETLKSNAQPPAAAPVPGPSQPSGVFQVLRVADLQPTKSVPRLKKSEVLKRAEERREELKAKLGQAKVKLWEATIEHGALLHLMRMAGEAEEASGSSSSQDP